MTERFRQIIWLRDPLPAALALDGDKWGDARENTVRNNDGEGDGEGKMGNENTVRKISLEERVVVGKARKKAVGFFAKCGVMMRGACTELEERIGPESMPGKEIAEERVRQWLFPEPGSESGLWQRCWRSGPLSLFSPD